jgi:hypothetical protein
MTTQSEQIEISIEQAENIINRGIKLQRLFDNADFNEIIMEDYLQENAIRLVHAKGNVACQTPEIQAGIERDMAGISSLSTYFNHIQSVALEAARDLENDKKTREEILAEEL